MKKEYFSTTDLKNILPKNKAYNLFNSVGRAGNIRSKKVKDDLVYRFITLYNIEDAINFFKERLEKNTQLRFHEIWEENIQALKELQKLT